MSRMLYKYVISPLMLLSCIIFSNFYAIVESFITSYLRICSAHEEITSIRLYTPGNLCSGLRKGVYNLIEVISNEPNNNRLIQTFFAMILKNIFIFSKKANNRKLI